MKIIVQRCRKASVSIEGEEIASIGTGLLLLVGFGQGDKADVLSPMAQKVSNLRIFPNESGRFDRSVLDVGGEILAVSQFTLYADTSKGRRPEFFQALAPVEAESLFVEFLSVMKATGVSRVASGVFGAYMQVALENDGPVTIILER